MSHNSSNSSVFFFEHVSAFGVLLRSGTASSKVRRGAILPLTVSSIFRMPLVWENLARRRRSWTRLAHSFATTLPCGCQSHNSLLPCACRSPNQSHVSCPKCCVVPKAYTTHLARDFFLTALGSKVGGRPTTRGRALPRSRAVMRDGSRRGSTRQCGLSRGTRSVWPRT